ncbi:dTDP-glucose 4,6-dehydratase [Cellulophaga algicola DSM 14237]|uniref:dTDP-glucose 4,6-dehydratase n=1 Tax=Cellulophaga algicola (strain DSM 14237 / IC166 / ACAM 630) TaxID=688270 RepID=E6XB30_CELAD|nr:acyltransferase [Cellulophaga algicola]ADV48886.1 dTDP-glucose 4,6-dehydratase [Cellulophaga algicola DSM 14237]
MKIDKLISKIKGDSNYKIQSEYSNIELFKVLYYRFFQVARGSWSKLTFIKTSGIFFKGKNIKIRHSQLFSAGKNLILGDYVFIDALSENGITLGNNVTIERNSIIVCTGVISNKGKGIMIGNNCGINANTFIGGQGGVRIGNHVIMGPGVKVFSENHRFDGIGNINQQGETRIGVEIKDNCWLGSGAIVLDGVTLGSKTVVAAGSVVTKSFNGNCIIGGIPAKIIKKL